MNPWFYELSQRLDCLTDRPGLLQALDDIEDHYDMFDDVDREIADQLIAALQRKLAALPAND